MLTTDTIVACASGAGRSPRAVIRVAGPGAHALAGRLCTPAPTRPGEVLRTQLEMGPGRGLPCLILRYDGPRSFTGQDQFELVLPGSPLLVDRVIRRLIAAGQTNDFREAGPGEFSARAFLNGKLTLQQADGIAALIAAQTDQQLGAAKSLLAGRAGERYQAWADELATLLALVEAGIDFTDQEDVVPITPGELAVRLYALTRGIRVELGSAGGSERRGLAARVVLVGAPNAGKSTLFNALLGKRRAVESAEAGTTRDAIEEELDLSRDVPVSAGLTVTLVDIAGLDDDGVAGTIGGEAQAVAREAIADADVIVWCDPTGRFIHNLPTRHGKPVVRVRTKADLPGAAISASRKVAIPVCSLDGWQMGALKRAIAGAAFGTALGGAAWLVPRHRRTLWSALERLEAALKVLRNQRATGSIGRVELVAVELRNGLDVMGELVGRVAPDDVIGRVFATFCVGK